MRATSFFQLCLFIVFALPIFSQGQNAPGKDSIDYNLMLSEYIKIKSLSGQEKAAGEFIRGICEENGLHVFQMGNTDGNFNFAASIRPLADSLPNIIFLNHIDVVPAGDSKRWIYPPFSGIITKDEIWGRGAFDNKGAAIIQLAAIIKLKLLYENIDIPYNVTFLAVSCEETQCEGGAKYVIDHHINDLNPVALLGEGPPALNQVLKSSPETNIFGISVAHKRALWIKLESTIYTSGHGSVTPTDYANKDMVTRLSKIVKKKRKAVYNDLNVDILKQLGAMETGVVGFVLRHPRLFKPLIVPQLRKQPEMFALFSNTLTLTGIDSHNDVVNIVPNLTTAYLDCRLLPLASEEKFLKQLRRRLKSNSIKMTIIKEMPKTEPSDDQNEFYNLLRLSILEKYPDSYVTKILVPNFSDVGQFRLLGIPSFSTIPVKLERSYLERVHNFNERIPKYIINDGSEVFFNFVVKCMESNDVSDG